MRKYFYALLLGLLITGCPARKDATPDTTGLADATRIVYSVRTPGRIISLAPALTENLKLILPLDRLVGRTDYCNTPAQIPSVGNIMEPSIERILALNPDIILATKEANQPAVIHKLRELGLKVFVFGESDSWKMVQDNFLLMGKLLGEESKASAILSNLNQQLSKVREHVPVGSCKVFIQLNNNPLMTAGNNTFINDIIKHTGCRNIAEDAANKWPVFNIEEVIRRAPDLIIISEMGEMTATAKDMWRNFPDIPAVKSGRIYVMPAELMCQPTPDNFVKAVSQIIEWNTK
ncbi:MAG: ABC transporter substrate-binding protein [Candidatus Brocadiia bacterium]